MSVYLTSDLHIGHKLAAECRGFDSIDEHDDAVMETVYKYGRSKRNLIWMLGDVCMKREKLEKFDMPAELRLVRGNHDVYNMDEYLSVFSQIHGFLRYKKFWLSHCPIHPQEIYRCRGNIHGHIHKNTSSPELSYPYFNLNWDFHRRLISLDEIRESFDRQERIKL